MITDIEIVWCVGFGYLRDDVTSWDCTIVIHSFLILCFRIRVFEYK